MELHKHQKFTDVRIVINGIGVLIRGRRKHHWWSWWDNCNMFNGEELITMKVSVGHNVNMGIIYLDQHGNPMLTTPTPDSPASWSKTADDSVDKLSPAADGNTAELDTLTAGNDTVTMSVTVGGATFAATLAVEIDPEPQVLTSVDISATAT